MDSGEIIESMEDEAWSHSPSLTHENEREKEERLEMTQNEIFP